MHTIFANNVNDAWEQAKSLILKNHVLKPSRNGAVMEYPTPVTTSYANPLQRVLFDSVRDANPFFHFHEALWMLAGRNDVAWISQFTSQMKQFSDDGVTFAGAYGFRWRQWFDMMLPEDHGPNEDDCDQLPKIVRMLKKSHEERRAVLTMWDPVSDLESPNCKDICCNLAIAFKIRAEKLDITVFNRSNDILLGCYGANAVHLSFLQEYVAAMIGVPVGTYYQVSDSWHAYTHNWTEKTGIAINVTLGTTFAEYPTPNKSFSDPYSRGIVEPYPLVKVPETWDDDLYRWMAMTEGKTVKHYFENPFFFEVATPLWEAWLAWKAKDFTSAYEAISRCQASDWKLACHQWLERREAKIKAKQEQA